MTRPIETDVQRAKRRLFARLIASAHLLDQPFIDEPNLSIWGLLKRDMEAFDAALKGVWVVPKIQHDENRSVTPLVRQGWVRHDAGQNDAEHARLLAAQLLAAADEAETTAEVKP